MAELSSTATAKDGETAARTARTTSSSIRARLELAAGVVDLHPHGSAAGLGGRGPLGERLQRRGGIEDDVRRAGQCLAVDHDVSGDQESGGAGQVRGAVHALFAASSAIP
ncbi:hypothetical protein [Streptomyces chrestomyceticus]|uniref:hypothetical protein n=1 Tax=Streptomyces chrestomyceticus TaxID=68185 RepID=UPI0019CFBA23|nr:hypothetical protein [Streptomyces chrestomyceticus]